MTTMMFPQGFSDTANEVQKATRERYQRLQESNSLGIPAVRDELGTVWEECNQPNWDGHRALAVNHGTLRNAYRFLEALPIGYSPPSIGAEPDGDLTLEWHHSPYRTLSVSVTWDDALHYAALIGPNRYYGTEAFFGDVPEMILALIRRVCAA